MRKLILAIVILLFILVGDGYSNTLSVNAAGDIFVETDRYQVRFKKGSFVHLHNKLTQETYTHPGRETIPDGIHHFAFNSYRIPYADFLEVEKVAPLAAKLTAVWQERQYQKALIMWVSIDAFSGDLIIKQEGFDISGAALIAWRLGNLDHNQVSVILPMSGGLLVNADTPEPVGGDFPESWQARLAILQGNTGGCSIMSTDETYQFHRLNYTRYPDAFEVEFITENFSPPEDRPEDYQHITSTTWRLNTYSGDWQVPAETYRQAMIQRNASRVAPKPAWVKDIQLVMIYCSYHRPQHILRMFDFVAKQINPKNVLFYCRSGWGDDPVRPDLSVREDLPWFMSAAKRHGFRVMLYTGFLFVDQDHPLYSEWDPFFYRGRDGNIMGYEMELGGPAYINPAYSGYREYYVQVLKDLQSTYNIDAFHLDVNQAISNQKPIEGLTSIQGNMLLHEELIAAMPGVVFSGEGVSEMTAPYIPLYSGGDNPVYTHPITDFLFSQWSRSYGGNLAYLAERHIPQEREILNRYINHHKHQNVIPTVRYHYKNHLEIQHAISIFHRTTSNAEFWEELGRMVNTPYREDLNFDGVVNILDLVIVANAFGDPIGPDLNGDDVVNILDLVIVANALN